MTGSPREQRAYRGFKVGAFHPIVSDTMAMGPRDFPIMAKYYKDPEQGWNMNWITMTLLGFGAILAMFVIVAWWMGRL